MDNLRDIIYNIPYKKVYNAVVFIDSPENMLWRIYINSLASTYHPKIVINTMHEAAHIVRDAIKND